MLPYDRMTKQESNAKVLNLVREAVCSSTILSVSTQCYSFLLWVIWSRTRTHGVIGPVSFVLFWTGIALEQLNSDFWLTVHSINLEWSIHSTRKKSARHASNPLIINLARKQSVNKRHVATTRKNLLIGWSQSIDQLWLNQHCCTVLTPFLNILRLW